MFFPAKEEKTIGIEFIGTVNENRKKMRGSLINEFLDKKIEFIIDWSLTGPIKVIENFQRRNLSFTFHVIPNTLSKLTE